MVNICLITEYYHPSYGGQYTALRSVMDICKHKRLDYTIIHKKSEKYKKKKLLERIISNSDIVHIFGGWTLFYLKVQKIAKNFNKKIIVHTMGFYEPWSMAQKKFKKFIAWKLYQEKLLLNADVIHCASKIEEINIKKLNPFFRTKVIPFGIKKNFFINKPEKKINKRFIFFSRLHEKKGLDYLLKAWSNFDSSGWKLDIIGSGDISRYEKISKTYNLKNIKFLKPIYGELKKKLLFKKYDILILPSQNENFGIVILEALARGLLVLTTNETPWNILQDKSAGWVINYSFEELCLVLNEIINKKQDFHRRRAKSISIARNFTYDKVSEKYSKLYYKLAKH